MKRLRTDESGPMGSPANSNEEESPPSARRQRSSSGQYTWEPEKSQPAREMKIITYDSVQCQQPVVVPANRLMSDNSHQQVQILWSTEPKSVLLIKKHQNPDVLKQVQELAQWLLARNKTVYVEDACAAEFPTLLPWTPGAEPMDLCVCLGGDGTLLHLNSLFQDKYPNVPPTIAFAAGTLGFLTPFEFQAYAQYLTPLLSKNKPFYCTLRMRLTVAVFKNGEARPHKTYRALNEVLIDRGKEIYLSELDLTVDGYNVTTVQADGLIVSTPTGSTAYSMSAGGSMVAPSVSAMLVTPICPHSLSFRPLILPDSAKVVITVPPAARHGCQVSFDGRHPTQLDQGDRVEVHCSRFPFPTVNIAGFSHEWFHSIKNKLNWGQRQRKCPSPLMVVESTIASGSEPDTSLLPKL